jgi:hypothetical protein
MSSNSNLAVHLSPSLPLTRLMMANPQRLVAADPHFCRHSADWRLRDLSLHIRDLYDQAAADGCPGVEAESRAR